MPPEVAFADLQFIIEFVYRGEIDVSEAELQVSANYAVSGMKEIPFVVRGNLSSKNHM